MNNELMERMCKTVICTWGSRLQLIEAKIEYYGIVLRLVKNTYG